jgi:hypothetical protein
MYAMDLYVERRFEEALKCLEEHQQVDMGRFLMRALLLAESGEPGRKLALEEHKKTILAYPRLTWDWSLVPLLLGEREVAVASLKKRTLVPYDGLKSEVTREFYEEARLFGRGESSEQKLLNKARGSRLLRHTAHLEIALFYLADNNRDDARRHFQLAAANRVYWYMNSFWPQMILSRMRDPAWPPWLPSKKSETKP